MPKDDLCISILNNNRIRELLEQKDAKENKKILEAVFASGLLEREVVYSLDIKKVCNSKKVTDHHAMRCAYGWADKRGVQFKFIVEFLKKKFTGRKKE